MSEKILIVDDEKEIADLVEVYLANEGYEVFKFYNGADALSCTKKENLSLAILDVMLPDIDGFALCQKIRENHLFPIIMLTAKVEDMDKIKGLMLGADDYVTKPFNPLELVARVKTQLRRYTRYNQAEEGLIEELDVRGPRRSFLKTCGRRRIWTTTIRLWPTLQGCGKRCRNRQESLSI